MQHQKTIINITRDDFCRHGAGVLIGHFNDAWIDDSVEIQQLLDYIFLTGVSKLEIEVTLAAQRSHAGGDFCHIQVYAHKETPHFSIDTDRGLVSVLQRVKSIIDTHGLV